MRKLALAGLALFVVAYVGRDPTDRPDAPATASEPAPRTVAPRPLDPPLPAAPEPVTAFVTGSNVNVRPKPSTGNTPVGRAHLNDQVRVLEAGPRWSRVHFTNGTVGWICSDHEQSESA